VKKTIVKICGNQSYADVHTSVAAGVDYIGFIFAESKRRVDPLEVSTWLKQLPKKNGYEVVGVFVNPTLHDLAEILAKVDLDVIQLHGKEPPSFVKEVQQKFSQKIWKALHYHEGVLDEMKRYVSFVDGFVIDSKVQGKWGGTGVSFHWKDVPKYNQFAEKNNKICLIAGGINPTNVQSLIEKGVMGIDLASGVERNGQKDPKLMQTLLERMNRGGTIS
jgi:phosphoribosylanthranilate isomerase